MAVIRECTMSKILNSRHSWLFCILIPSKPRSVSGFYRRILVIISVYTLSFVSSFYIPPIAYFYSYCMCLSLYYRQLNGHKHHSHFHCRAYKQHHVNRVIKNSLGNYFSICAIIVLNLILSLLLNREYGFLCVLLSQ